MDFQILFTESKGQAILYKDKEIKMIDEIDLKDSKINIRITFVSTNSKWKQGVILQTKGYFQGYNKKANNKIVLWEDTAPKEIELSIHSRDMILIIYNVWETEDGTVHYWHNGGAMNIEEKNNTKTYNCNDGFPDEDFDDLIFKVQFI